MNTTDTPAKLPRPDRFVVGLAIGALLLVGLALVSVVVLQRQPPPKLDLSTPSGVVLAYLQAYRSGNDAEIRGYYSQRVLTDAKASPGSSGTPPLPIPPRPNVVPDGSQRLEVLNSQINGDQAFVDVRITTFRVDSPVSPSEYTYTQRVQLVREAGQWKIDQPFVPY